MDVGVPREVKPAEGRVGLTPNGARELVGRGHRVLVERGAGLRAGLPDDAYVAAGAALVDDPADAWDTDLVVKVKEPVDQELRYFRPELILFTYLHLASAPVLTHALVRSGCTAIAYETVAGPNGDLPLLAPMSRIAGVMAGQVAACELFAPRGGNGSLVGGMPGVAPVRATVLGAGMAGFHAARVLAALGARVTVLDIDLERLAAVERSIDGPIVTLPSSDATVAEATTTSDVVVGAVLVPGARAPKVLPRAVVAAMPPGTVLVDVSIDQGGCADTSRPTTHAEPTYTAEGVLHYCVGNMPGAVPRTATAALTNVTLPHVVRLAERGAAQAVRDDPGLAAGLSVVQGAITHRAVAEAHGLPWSHADR